MDTRDYDINHLATGKSEVTLSGEFIPTIYDQNKVPNCGPEMMNFKLNFLFPGIVGSPKFVSKQTRLLDGFPPNSGTDMRTVFKAAKNRGTCDLSLMPDDTATDSLADYWSPRGITQPLVIQASSRSINWYGFTLTPPTWSQMQSWIATFGMVECLISLGTGFYTPSWNPADIFPLKIGTPVDNHFIELVRPDIAVMIAAKSGFKITPNPDYIYFVTQWSTGYGAGGVGWFTEEYLPHILEVGVSGI
jgi:hypothetical protein